MKRPNPVNGQTVKLQDPNLVHTKEELARAVAYAQRDARRKVFEELGITDLTAVRTPSALWFAEAAGGDPFPELINKERGSLCLGDHTDDQLANEIFLYGDMSLEEKHRALVTGKCTSIAYLTAGKERIRWLSRHLESALAREELLLEQVQGLRQLILDFEIELPDGSKPEIPAILDLKDGMETVIRDKHGCSGVVRPLSIPADKVWAFLVENDEYQGYNPEYFRKHALEILPAHYVEKAMQPILTKMYLDGDIDKDGTRSGCLGSVVAYSGPIFKGTIPEENKDGQA